MSKINWLHISDLHFGTETKIKDIKTIRDKFLDYVKEKFDGKITFDYLFVTGDIFNGNEFFNASSNENQRELIDAAKKFFNDLISNMNISRDKVYIVPGNHDTNRRKGEKEIYIEGLRTKYTNGIKVFDEKAMEEYKTKYQAEFNNFCKELGVKYCDKAHKLDERDDADVLMLNTSISSYKSKEKSNLLLAKYLFGEEVKKIKPENMEDESRPLFILAHHSPDYFIESDIRVMKSEFEQKKDSALYLCGHNHFADVKKIENINVLFCGTDVETEEERKNSYRKNEVNFLRGSFDPALEETTVYFYKWSREQWMENRDLRQDKHPHHGKTIEGNSRKTKILKSKSESEAVKEFYKFLLKELYDKSNQRQDDKDKYAYFKQQAIFLIDTIEEKKPEWRFEDKFKDKFNTNTDELETLKDSIKQDYQNYREVDGLIREKISFLTDKINEKKKESKDKCEWKFGILLYSKSIRVTNYLLSLSPCIKKKCIIYICAGNVRGNTLYKDGLDIADELFDLTISDFKGFGDVKLIPDIYVDKIIKEDKIHAVLLGAVALYYLSGNYTYFSNTVGSGLIVDLATKKGIDCFVIAEQSKTFNSYPNPKAFNLYNNSKDKEKIKESDYPNEDLIKHIKPEFEEFELVEFKGSIDSKKITLISDLEINTSIQENKELLQKNDFLLFLNKILKERRKLSLSNDKKTITKTFLPEDDTIESDIILKLRNAGIAIPDIVSDLDNKKDKCITLKYYKGIRIFNFLVALKPLRDEYKDDSSKINQLDVIAKILLSRCEEKQKRIQKELYEQYKNLKPSPYPKEKLTEIIELFFICFESDLKAKIDKQIVLKEMDDIYDNFFKVNVKIPFRDASTKNMILVHEKLYFEQFQGNDIKRNAEIKKLFDNNKLYDIVLTEDKNIIDIDFSSCVNYTTPYDDEISFKFHESTAPYYPSYDLTWNNIPFEAEAQKESIVATFIMRFLRFGGRKLLYRVIDPIHHTMRFKHDDESYYFKNLPKIIEHYGVTEKLHETIKLFKEIENIIEKNLKEKSQKQKFIIPYDDPDVMKIIKEISENGTYSDVYPY